MKLYVNKEGVWCGTQAEAKKIGAEVTEVPTDKQSLITFLNLLQREAPPSDKHQTTSSHKVPNHIQLIDAANEASLQDLQHVVYRYLMKVDDALDLKRKK